ncbi:MAG: Type 1 glutamine amidotransferase-like domain-containing protein, partial [Bacteroidales bacterium]|nr:Type 1 glutamine amidotransferase-like domain-containing protein [Bacteroidales bacterium]
MKLLLISNSTMAGEAYLGWCKEYIKSFMKSTTAKKILFVPYAGVSLSPNGLEASYDTYEAKVAGVFKTLGYELTSIHHAKNPVEAVEQAEAIAVGGGNTFHLV